MSRSGERRLLSSGGAISGATTSWALRGYWRPVHGAHSRASRALRRWRRRGRECGRASDPRSAPRALLRAGGAPGHRGARGLCACRHRATEREAERRADRRTRRSTGDRRLGALRASHRPLTSAHYPPACGTRSRIRAPCRTHHTCRCRTLSLYCTSSRNFLLLLLKSPNLRFIFTTTAWMPLYSDRTLCKLFIL